MSTMKKSLGRKMKMYVLIPLIIVSSIFVIGIFASIDTSIPVTPKTVQTQPQKVDVAHDIAEEQDISIGGTGRLILRAVVSESETQDNLKKLTQSLVERYKDRYDEITFFYFFHKYQINGAYTIATAEWLGQDIKYKFKDRSAVTGEAPTEEDREINKAMKDLWTEKVNASDDPVTDEEVAKVLAPQYDKTSEEMLEIRERVNAYDNAL